MRGKVKQLKLMLLVCMFGILLIPTSKSMAATALSKDDFISQMDGKKFDFYTETNTEDEYGYKMETAYYIAYNVNDKTGYCKGRAKEFVTSRAIKFGSNASAVTKKYGKASKVQYKENEKFHKYVKYAVQTIDTSAWTSYMEYTYKERKDKYQIRFYLNKKNKVVAVAYIKNLNKFTNYANKQVKTGLSFKAPSGKKITTQTIGGKKVYILPKGTKLTFDKSKANCEYVDAAVNLYDVYGDAIAYSGLGCGAVEGAKIDKLITECYIESNNKPLKANKLGKYRYFVLYFNAYDEEVDLAPEIFYFRIK